MSESIVTSLHWSKELQKAGWPQTLSSFWWARPNYDIDQWGCFSEADPFFQGIMRDEKKMVLVATAAEEILWKLPQKEPQHEAKRENGMDACVAWLEIYPIDEWWAVSYEEDGVGAHIKFQEDTLANAAAAMYCYLAENGLLPKA